MPKAIEVANELRKVVELLEKQPDAEIKKANLNWWTYERADFLAVVPFIPRPAKKRVEKWGSNADFHFDYTSDALSVGLSAPQSKTCTLVKPAQEAVYDCVPLLSQEDESELV